jgi:hypothetical protein
MMKIRKTITIIILLSLTLFTFGCEKKEVVDSENNKQVENKEVIKPDFETILKYASYSSEENPKDLSMEESVEYVMNVLPKGAKETEKTFEEEVGVTQVKYETTEGIVKVRYMHPYKTDGPYTLEEHNLDRTAGIYLERDK